MTLKRLAFAALFLWSAPTWAAKPFDIAITVDDLPLQGEMTSGPSRLDIARSYVKTLKAHGVPEAYGFINAGKLANAPDGGDVYDFWLQSGYPLGNHGFTHMNLGRAPSLADWIADMETNEAALKSRVKDDSWRVLRFPNLSAGGKGARHKGAVDWIRANRYSVAEVTVFFSDSAYTRTYNRCMAKGDLEAIAALKVQYLNQVDEGIVRMKALSKVVYGRVIPQVLLTHISGFSAQMLPEVMQRLDKAGARYVTLANAQSDSVYTEPENDIGNGLMMERAAKRLGTDLKDVPSTTSSANLETLCK